MVGYGKECSFGRQKRAETMLGWGKKMVGRHVGVKLMLDSLLYQFGEGWNDRNGAKVGWIDWVTGFMDGMHDRVFPGGREVTRCEIGVDQEEDMTNAPWSETASLMATGDFGIPYILSCHRVANCPNYL